MATKSKEDLVIENVLFRILLRDCEGLLEDYIERIESKDSMTNLYFGRSVLQKIRRVLRNEDV